MSDENIVIDVQDKVNPQISDNLLKIASSARSADSSINRLKNSLKELTDNSSLARLQSEVAKLNNELIRNIEVQNKAGQASLSTALSQQKLATEVQRTQVAMANAEAALNRAVIAETNAANAEQRLAASTAKTSFAKTQAATAAQRLATEEQRTAIQTANAAAASDRAALAALRLQQAQERANKTVSAGLEPLGKYVLYLAGLAGAGYGAYSIIQYADAYVVLQNKLQNVAESQSQVNELTRDLFDLANRTRSPVEATATAFTRFDRSLKSLGKSQEDTLRLTETINKALVVSGATSEESGSALLQLSQAFNSGKLQGDEFRAVAENMPIVLDAIAKSTGKPINAIKQMGTDGKITSEVLFNAFKYIEKSIDETFNKTTPTISQALTILKNKTIESFGEFNKATGFTNLLANAIVGLANHLPELTFALSVLASALLAAFGPVLINAIRACTTAVIDFNLAIATNPIGLLIVGLTTAISYLLIFGDKINAGIDKTTTLQDVSVAAWRQIKGEIKDTSNEVINYVKNTNDLDLSPVLNKLSKNFSDFFDTEYNGWAGFFQKIAKLFDAITGPLFSSFKAVGAAIENAPTNLNVDEWKKYGQNIAEIFLKGFDFKNGVGSKAVNGVLEDAKKIAEERDLATAFDVPGSTLRQSGPNTAGPTVDKATENRAAALAKINAQLDNEKARLFELKPEREAQAKFDSIEETLIGRKITLTDKEKESIRAKIEEVQKATLVQSAFDRIYEKAVQPQNDYAAAIEAADKAMQKGLITQQQYNGEIAGAKESYLLATQPLYEFNKQLNEESKLLSLNKDARTIEQQVIQISNEKLRERILLTEEEKQGLREKLELIREQNLIQQASDELYESSIGVRERLAAQTIALNKAYDDGSISLEQYSSKMNQVGLDALKLKENLGDASFTEVLTSSIGSLIENYQTMLSGLDEAFSGFFQRLEDGFANSIGHAIVYADNLHDALTNVYREALAGLISALIKLGIQWVINAALGESLSASAMATQTALSVAAASETAIAWAPAAAMVSLASYGANSIAADAGIVSTAALADSIALSSVAGFESGGYTGDMPTNAIAGVVHGKEFVFDAEATSRIGIQNLQAMQRGDKPVSSATSQNSNGNANTQQEKRIVVINVLDENLVKNYLDNSESDTVFVNKISNNSESINQVLKHG